MLDHSESESKPVERAARLFTLLTTVVILACAGAARGGDAPFAELERKMIELVNKDRAEHQKKACAADESLAAVARAHSADMVKNGFFSHKSPTTGMVADRLWAARVKVFTGAENIAMNASVEEAEAKLMESPAHRENILSDLYTHVGVGIVRASNGLYCITQVFAAPAPEVSLKTLREDVIGKLNKSRVAKGKLPFQVNATLNQLAADEATASADAGKAVPVDIGAKARAAGLPNRRLAMAHLISWNPGELADSAALLQPTVGRIGIAFAENTKHKELGYGILWTVVIFTND